MSWPIVLLIIWLVSLSLYIPLNRRRFAHYLHLPLDAKIPCIPLFVVPYLGFHFYILIATILIWQTSWITPYLVTHLAAQSLAVMIWWLYPTGVHRQKRPAPQHGLDRILNLIYTYDGDNNALPSNHVFMTTITSWYLLLAFPHYLPVLFLTWTLICLSTLYTKQHYVLDAAAGLVLASACLLSVHFVLDKIAFF